MSRFRLILSLIILILLVNFSLIVHFEFEQKRAIKQASQLGMENQLWQYFQLSNEYQRLREIVEHSQPNQLDQVLLRFDIFYSRIHSFETNGVEDSDLLQKRELRPELLNPVAEYIHNSAKLLDQKKINEQEWRDFQQKTQAQQHYVNDIIQDARVQNTNEVENYLKTIASWGNVRTSLAIIQIVILILLASVGVYALWRSEQNRKRLSETADSLLEARQQAENANAAKSRFLAHISHEIRTPLTSILGYTDRLLRKPTLAAAEKREIGYIANSGTHLLSLLNHVLDLSKSEQNKLSTILEVLNLKQLKLEIESMFHMMAEEKGLDLQIYFDPLLPENLNLDAGKFRQILINLLGNSLKFTEQGFIHLTLKGQALENSYLLQASVKDSGCGIHLSEQARLFSPFEQSEMGQLAGGTGLGLALSRDYARLMNGDIVFTSAPNVGSEFIATVEAHVIAALLVPQAPAAPNPSSLAKMTVLVAEDQHVNRDLMCEVLNDFGAKTYAASNGLDAIAQVKAHPEIDCIIMDYQMPEMNGINAASVLRKQGWDKAIYLVSASPLSELEATPGFAAFNGHLRKPFKIDELVQMLCQGQGQSSSAASAAPDTVLDAAGAMNRLGFTRERYVKLSQKGLNRITELEPLYQDALHNQAIAEAIRHAHSAKGIAQQIGAERLGQRWAELEINPVAIDMTELAQLRQDAYAALAKI